MPLNPIEEMLLDSWGREPEDEDVLGYDTIGMPEVEAAEVSPAGMLEELDTPSQGVRHEMNIVEEEMNYRMQMMDMQLEHDDIPKSSILDIPKDITIGFLEKFRLPTVEGLFGEDSEVTETYKKLKPAIRSLPLPTTQTFDFLDTMDDALDGLQNLFGDDGQPTGAKIVGKVAGDLARFSVIGYALGGIPALAANKLYVNSLRAGLTGLASRLLDPATDDTGVIDRIHGALANGAYSYLFTYGLGKAWQQLPKIKAGGEATARFTKTIWDRIHNALTTGAGGVKKVSTEEATAITKSIMDTVEKQGGGGALIKAGQRMVNKLKPEDANLERARRAFKANRDRLGWTNKKTKEFLHGLYLRTSTKTLDAHEMDTARELMNYMDDTLGPASKDMSYEKAIEWFVKTPEKQLQGTNFRPNIFSWARPSARVFYDMGQKHWNRYRQVLSNEVGRLRESFQDDAILMKLRKIAKKEGWDMKQHMGYQELVHTKPTDTVDDIAKAFHAKFSTIIEGKPTLLIPESQLNALIQERVMTTGKFMRIARAKRGMYKAGIITKNQLDKEMPGWTSNYTPRKYTQAIVGSRFDVAKSGLSIDEYKLFNKKMWNVSVPDKNLNARTILDQFDKVEHLLDTSDYYKHLARVMRSGTRTLYHEPALRSWLKFTQTSEGKLNEAAYDYLTKFINQGVLERQSWFDKKLGGFAAKKVVAQIKAMGYMGTMWMNPVPWTKQILQQGHNIAKVGGKHWLKGLESIVRSGKYNPVEQELAFTLKDGSLHRTGMNGFQFALKHSKTLQGRQFQMFHDYDWSNPKSLFNIFLKLGMYPYRVLDTVNVVSGFNGAVSKSLREGSNIKTAIKYADEVAELAQYNYLNIAKPLAMHNSLGSLAGQFMSWPLNYFEFLRSFGGRYVGEGIKGAKGQLYNMATNEGLARYLATIAILGATADAMGVDFGMKKLVKTSTGLSLIPLGVGPSPKLIFHTGMSILAAAKTTYNDSYYNRKQLNEHLRGIQENLEQHVIPSSVVLKKLYKITDADFFSSKMEKKLKLKGDLPWYSLFLPVSSYEYKQMQNDLVREWDEGKDDDWY